MTHVPYKGGRAVKRELIAGASTSAATSFLVAHEHQSAGSKRSPPTPRAASRAPGRATVRGWAIDPQADGWNGFFVPAKTPREVIDRLQKETAAAVRHPETAKRLMEIGAEPVGSTPAEQDAILKRQVQQFRPVIQEMKIEN
jgi:tripartite-type tricarboxylate transporter receptor subunit TctC